jgi:hypothetical protein
MLKSTGEQCRTEAHPGTNVCFKHGANAPAIQAAAARRIQTSVEDAVKRLQQMLDDPQVEARDKIKILHDLLDRGGLGATSKVLVGVAEVDPVESLFRDILADPQALAAHTAVQVHALPAGEARRDADEGPAWAELLGGREGAEDVVEAELVDEPEPTGQPHTIDGGESGKTPSRISKSIERELRRLL